LFDRSLSYVINGVKKEVSPVQHVETKKCLNNAHDYE